jgi:hypothetical protein
MLATQPVERRPPRGRPGASCISPRTILRASQSVNPANDRYLPLLLSLGVVDVGEDVLGELDDDEPLGDALDDDELVSEEAGGVLELDDPVAVDGVDDIELLDDVEGGVVVDGEDDVEGDGVTTGGVVPVVDDDSRLQPARPSTSPVHSTVINALFIAISR